MGIVDTQVYEIEIDDIKTRRSFAKTQIRSKDRRKLILKYENWALIKKEI